MRRLWADIYKFAIEIKNSVFLIFIIFAVFHCVPVRVVIYVSATTDDDGLDGLARWILANPVLRLRTE